MSGFWNLLSNKAFVDQVHNALMAIFGAGTAAGVASTNSWLTAISGLAMFITTVSSTVNALRKSNAPNP